MIDSTDEEQNNQPDERVLKILEIALEHRDRKLNLNERSMSVMPTMILKLTHLQYLYMNKNNLKSIPKTFAQCLPNLQWLDLRFNAIDFIPDNISLLKNLKNFLLQGNKIKMLPLQLGYLTNLTGLNLTENPIEFPPSSILECGTKAVLKYLREQIAIEERFGSLDFTDSASSATDYDLENDLEEFDSTEEGDFYDDTPKIKIPKAKIFNAYRRQSLDENMILDQTDQTPVVLKKKLVGSSKTAVMEKQRISTSAPSHRKQKSVRHKDAVLQKNHNGYVKKSLEKKKGHYFRDELPDTQYLEEIKRSERKKINVKADEIIQKRKNKDALDDWRRTTKLRQNKKRYNPSKSKHELNIPFGNDLQQQEESTSSIQIDGKSKGLVDKNTMLRELRDKKLEEKIQEHIKNIREWKRVPQTLTVENEIETAKNNLQKAIDLQRALEQKRAIEYRLRAFTGEDFAPAIHVDKTQRM